MSLSIDWHCIAYVKLKSIPVINEYYETMDEWIANVFVKTCIIY